MGWGVLLLLLSYMSRGLNLKDYIHARGGADTRGLTQRTKLTFINFLQSTGFFANISNRHI